MNGPGELEGRLWLRSLRGVAIFLLLLCAFLISKSSWASLKPDSDWLVLGVFAYLGEEETRRRYQPLVDYLDSRLVGLSVALEVLSLEDLERGVADQTLDFVTTTPTHFLSLRHHYPLSGVIATMVRDFNGQPVHTLGGVILTRVDRPSIQTLEDLRGGVVAAAGSLQLGGFRAPAMELLRAGVRVPADLGELLVKRSHQEVLAAVLDGTVDAGFVRTGILEDLRIERPLAAMMLRVINQQTVPGFPFALSTRLYPEWPLFALPHVDDVKVRRFAAALFDLEAGNPAAVAAGLHGFTAPADYLEVEQISRILRLDPFNVSPAVDWTDVWLQYRDWITFGSAIALLLSILAGAYLVLNNRRLRQQRADLTLQRAQLAELEAERSAVLGAIGEGVYGCDLRGRTTFINPAALKMLGYTEQELLHQKQHILTHFRRADGLPYPERECPIHLTARDGKTRQAEDWFIRKDGTGFSVGLIATPLHRNGQRVGSVVAFCDITARKATEQQMRKLSAAIEQNPASILITDPSGRIEYINQACALKTGYEQHELLGMNPRVLQSGKTPPAVYADMWTALGKGQVWRGELTNRRKDGTEFIDLTTIAPVRGANSTITHFVSIQYDISDLKQAEEQVHQLANFDPLTGLPNRGLLQLRLEQLVQGRDHFGGSVLLLIIDIDRFKNVNHARGQGCGDRILGMIAQRLRSRLGHLETLARLSADEFALISFSNHVRPEAASRDALLLAEQLQHLIREPFTIDSPVAMALSVTASIGVALFPDPALGTSQDSAQEILRRAGTALQKAKSAGGNQTALFDHELGKKAQSNFQIESELRQGVMRNELRLFLQPKVNSSKEIFGYEALVRWQHPTRGLVPPAVFIPIAEESDLICDIGVWVFTEVCNLIKRQQQNGINVQVAVNISPRQFRTDDFVSWLEELLDRTGVDPHQLTLEVTENLMILDSEGVIVKMAALRELGLRLSIDDFGTGYSSLAYLKRLPIQELKIDQSFIQDVPADADGAALVKTILAIARNLKLDTVAEGVETEVQAEFLHANSNGALLCQGYLFGYPKPASDWLP